MTIVIILGTNSHLISLLIDYYFKQLKKGMPVSAISYLNDGSSEDIETNLPVVKSLMSAVGDVEVISESLMNAAGAVSGSGPAYVSTIYL